MTTPENANDSTSKDGGFLDSAIEKGGDFVDKKTGNKYESQVDKGQDFLSEKYGKSDTSEKDHTPGDTGKSTERGN